MKKRLRKNRNRRQTVVEPVYVEGRRRKVTKNRFVENDTSEVNVDVTSGHTRREEMYVKRELQDKKKWRGMGGRF